MLITILWVWSTPNIKCGALRERCHLHSADNASIVCVFLIRLISGLLKVVSYIFLTPLFLQPAFTRTKTLTRTQALEGTSPPPESLPNQQCHMESRGSSLDVPGHSLTNGGSVDSSTGQLSSSASSTSLGLLQKKGQSSSQEAKEFLLASQKVSNVRIFFWCLCTHVLRS